MKKRVKKYEETSPVEFLLLREKLGLKRYRKTAKRDDEKRKNPFGTRSKKDRRERKGRFSFTGLQEKKSQDFLKDS